MMCRVIAPMAGWLLREATKRSPDRRSPRGSTLYRRLRMARRRALRWFSAPIAITERARRDHLAPSLWAYGFEPWPVLGRVHQMRRVRRPRRVSLVRAGY